MRLLTLLGSAFPIVVENPNVSAGNLFFVLQRFRKTQLPVRATTICPHPLGIFENSLVYGCCFGRFIQTVEPILYLLYHFRSRNRDTGLDIGVAPSVPSRPDAEALADVTSIFPGAQ
jgi:hypothetical protein